MITAMRMLQTSNQKLKRIIVLSLFAACLLPQSSNAQPFLTPNNGDLLAGFRKTGANQANYEVVVNIGNITNLEAMAPGAQVTFGSRFTAAQLAGAFSDLNNLQWSVFASFKVFGSWAGFPNYTAWVTVPRDTFGSQSTPPGRLDDQTSLKSWLIGVGIGAAYISSSGVSNVNNTAYLVREPSGDTQHALSVYIGDPNDSTLGDFNAALPFSVENNTGPTFSSAVRSDLYQSCPNGTTDPNTHSTGGSDYYVGYFQFNPDGSLSFTRASSGTVTLPAPQIVSATRAGNLSTISFTTTNGANYTLYYTNTAGLTTPVSSWTIGSSLTGDGTTRTLTDTTTDAARVYRVRVQ